MSKATTSYPILTLDSAPQGSRPALEQVQASVGMIPNLAGVMAQSPTLLQAFVAIREIFLQGTFSELEREVILLTNAVENGCNYCQAIHSTFALGGGLEQGSIDRIRRGEQPEDTRLAALVTFERTLLRERGRVSDSDLEPFLGAGFRREQALELLTAAALSSMANYAGRMTETRPDDAIRGQYA